jgi:hypothetical protein
VINDTFEIKRTTRCCSDGKNSFVKGTGEIQASA